MIFCYNCIYISFTIFVLLIQFYFILDISAQISAQISDFCSIVFIFFHYLCPLEYQQICAQIKLLVELYLYFFDSIRRRVIELI